MTDTAPLTRPQLRRLLRNARRALAPAVERAGFTVAELAELHGLIVEEGKLASSRRG